ncbi:MAG: FG-GAP repeat protein, partial [Pseudomonadota bacterium]
MAKGLVARLLLLSTLTVAAHGALGQANLVRNPGAEEAPCALNSSPQVVVPEWIVTDGTFNCIQWGSTTGGWPDENSPGPSDRGAGFFQGGQSSLSRAVQLLDLSAAAARIDAGAQRYTLSGWLGGFSNQGDAAAVVATFLDDEGIALGSATIGPVAPGERANTTGLIERVNAATVPPGSRQVEIAIILTRSSGISNDGYADSIVFSLDDLGEAAVPPAPDPAPDDRLGEAVATDGSLVAIGRPGVDGGAGEVRIFRIEGGTLVLDAVIAVPADRLAQNFGAALALVGDRLLVGAPGTPRTAKGGRTPLQAALYQRATGAWDMKADFSSDADGDDFGASVSLDGTLVAIGAPRDDEDGADAGAAHVFRLDGANSVIDDRKIVPGGAAAGSRFGQAIAASGGTVAIGAPALGTGSVRLIDQIQQNLAFTDRGDLEGDAAGDAFGAAVALDGGTMVVGAPGEDGAGADRGALVVVDPT